jgi:hypothetical protein
LTGPVDPKATLFTQGNDAPERTQNHLFAFRFKLQSVTGAEIKFITQGLGDHYAARFVESEFGCHIGTA